MQGLLEDFQGDKDMANLRTVGLPDGTEVKLNRTDPYGLIELKLIGKDTPVELSGSYTTFEQARKALNTYADYLVLCKSQVLPKRKSKAL